MPFHSSESRNDAGYKGDSDEVVTEVNGTPGAGYEGETSMK